MTNAQRWFLAVAAIAMAGFLHTLFFEWFVLQPAAAQVGGHRVFWSFCWDPMAADNYHGCVSILYWPEYGESYVAATVLGVVAPVCLLVAAAYLLMALRKTKSTAST